MKKLFVALLLAIFFLFGCCFKHGDRLLPQQVPIEDVKTKQQIISNIEGATVALQTMDVFGSTLTYCAGVWISHHKIITAGHCVLALESTKSSNNVEFRNKNELDISNFPTRESVFPIHKAKIILVDELVDLAILHVSEDLIHNIAEINKLPLVNGQNIHVIGHTSGMIYSYSPGSISQTRTFNEINKSYELIQVMGFISMGNSGGGAFDEAGRLIGICSFVKKSAPNMSFFVSFEEINKAIKHNKINLD